VVDPVDVENDTDVVESAVDPWHVVQPDTDAPVLPVELASATGRATRSASRAVMRTTASRAPA
jgi:hypothetical protein